MMISFLLPRGSSRDQEVAVHTRGHVGFLFFFLWFFLSWCRLLWPVDGHTSLVRMQ